MQHYFFCCVWGTKSLKPSYLQHVNQWKKRFNAKTLWKIHISNSRFKFLYQIASLDTGTPRDSENLDCCPIQIVHLLTIPNLHTLANAIISGPVVIHEL